MMKATARLPNKETNQTKKTMKIQTKLMGLAAAGAVLLASVDSANAVPTIKVDTGLGGAIYTFTDGDADGVVSGQTPISDANFTVTVSSLITKPADGSATDPVLQTSLIFTSKKAATLRVWFEENDFGPSGVTLQSQVTSIFGAAANASFFYDTSNADNLMPIAAGGTTFLLAGPSGFLVPPNGEFLGTGVVPDLGSPYTLIGYLEVAVGGASVTGGAQLSVKRVVPDGGSTVAFLGMALVAVEGVRRKFAKA